MATHFSTLVWKIPWMEEPDRLQSMGSRKSRTWLSKLTFTFHSHALEKEMATHSSVLAWRIPGTGEPGGLLSMGSHRVWHDWSDLAAAATSIKFQLINIFHITVSTYLWTFLLWIAYKIDSNEYSPFYLMYFKDLMTWRHAEKYPVRNNNT